MPPDREIWDRAVKAASQERPVDLQQFRSPQTLPEIIADKAAIHKALRESRMRHTVRVKSRLP
jgi:hypothetical protein